MIRRFPLLFLLGITMLSCWLVWRVLVGEVSKLSNPNFPDQFVKNIQVTVMDTDGQLAYGFSSPTMWHYMTNDRITFTSPTFILYAKGEPPWIATAQQGESYHGNQIVQLWGHVQLMQAASTINPWTKITAHAVTIYPKDRVVTTNQFISAQQPNAEIDSIGMRLSMLQQQLNLLSQVHGYYAKSQK